MNWVQFIVIGHQCGVTGYDIHGNLLPFKASSLTTALAFQGYHGGRICPV